MGSHVDVFPPARSRPVDLAGRSSEVDRYAPIALAGGGGVQAILNQVQRATDRSGMAFRESTSSSHQAGTAGNADAAVSIYEDNLLNRAGDRPIVQAVWHGYRRKAKKRNIGDCHRR